MMGRLRSSIAVQAAGAILLLDVLLLAVGVVGLMSSASLHDRLSAVSTRDLAPLVQLREAQNMHHSIVITNFAAGATRDKNVAASVLNLIPGYNDRLDAALAKLHDVAPPEFAGQVDDLIATHRAFVAADKAFRADPNGEGAQKRSDAAAGLFQQAEAKFDKLAQALASDAAKQRADVEAAYQRERGVTLALIAAGLGLGVVLALFIARVVRSGAAGMVFALEKVAAGDLTTRVDEGVSGEFAQMGSALNRSLAAIQSTLAEVATVAGALAGSANSLNGSAEENARSAQLAASGIDGVVSGSQQVTYSVDAAASSTRELSMSIREIAENATRAAKVAGDAVDVVHATNATISQLGNSSQEIGNVIQVIQNIAAQTSLLALNATIEAARAGDAGRGFAVVAGEVKELARETAEATESVISRVQAIQADTEGAVRAIGEIGEIIQQINAFQGTIASAVEEQSVTTESLSAGISSALDVTRDIESQIQTVSGSAQAGAGAVSATRSLASDVASQGQRLRDLVGAFRL